MGRRAGWTIAILTAAILLVIGLRIFGPRPAAPGPVAVPAPAAVAAPVPELAGEDPLPPPVILRGRLRCVGSDSMVTLMQAWAERFRVIHREVVVEIEARGSAGAAWALLAGDAHLGFLSRPFKEAELRKLEERLGQRPITVRVASEALGVFVHRDNPIRGLTLAQLDAMFSRTRRSGHVEVRNWGQLGLGGEWAERPIVLHGRQSSSSTHVFFREQVLRWGEFRDEVREAEGSASVVHAVSTDLHGIGYAGLGYGAFGVRAVPLARAEDGPWIDGSAATAADGTYPLARSFSIAFNKAPGQPLDPLLKSFLTFILSTDGREIVVKDGYYALPAPIAAAEMARLE